MARAAADILRREFGAVRVVVFGSLAHGAWFGPRSDVDLAVWGLDVDAHLIALAHLQDIDPEFSVDVVRVETCSAVLRTVVEREGVDL